jgi:UDP-N-acetylglucosamine acyltransferase
VSVHPTAIVDPSARIDPTATVGPYAVIGPQAVIGPRCAVGPHAVVEHVRMGADNRIHAGAFVGTAPQDLKYQGEKTVLIMGDRNIVRECVTLNRGTAATGETRIGSNCLFMAYTHVAHDCRVGDHVILANCVALAGHVEAGDYSVFGGFAGLHQFVRVGRCVMVGAGAMVAKDVPSFCTCQGDRATLRGLNLIGMRRVGLGREAVKAIKDAYHTLFLSGLTQENALADLKASSPPPEVQEMVRFIEGSKRGITRPATGAVLEEEVTL